MVQIPDNIRPTVDAVVKHHFWILLGLVPLVVLPMVFLARGRLATEIDSARSQIESRLSAVRSVAGIQPHPNEAWSSAIDKVTTRVKKDTLDEWDKLWASQQPLRVWPESLGPDFLARITALKPGGKLPRPLLERYQNGVRAIVRTLPKRMGADELMVEGAAAGPGQALGLPPGGLEPGMVRGRPGAPEKPVALVQWNPADQARLYASFNWEKAPSTTQVLLAQEELWVYGVLADAIARVNKTSAGAYNAAIPFVEQLAVGYPAAEDDPGAAAGRRILLPTATGGANPMGEFAPPPDPAMMEGGTGGPAARPAHPRFSGGGFGPGMGGPMLEPTPGGEAPAEAATSPDDLLRNWIYVDFTGKPLMAADLATSPDARLVHLVPFVIKAIVDERKLDALLVDLASAPVPIDVRQVRINPGAAGPAMGGPGMGGPGMGGLGMDMPGGSAAPPGSRPNDVVVELRGTVALATPPERQALGLETEAEEGDDGAGADAAAEPEERAAPAAAPAEDAAEPADDGAPQPAPAEGNAEPNPGGDQS
ncbi:MAG: hypothetical protein ACKOBP_04150 [Planctomycetia bacterium]